MRIEDDETDEVDGIDESEESEELTFVFPEDYGHRVLSFSQRPRRIRSEDHRPFNSGYLILEQIYHRSGLASIAAEIAARHPDLEFSPDEMLRRHFFERFINILSETDDWTMDRDQDLIEFPHLSKERTMQKRVRALELLTDHQDLVQDRLLHHRHCEPGSRANSTVYYDCLTMSMDNGRARTAPDGQHNLARMGLFFDGDGVPLCFCLNPGNTTEPCLARSLREKILHDFAGADLVLTLDRCFDNTFTRRYSRKHKLSEVPRRLGSVEAIREVPDVSGVEDADRYLVLNFMVGFLCVLFIRSMERAIARTHPDYPRYPAPKYRLRDLIHALNEIQVIRVPGGYLNVYPDTEVVSDLHEAFELPELCYEAMTDATFAEMMARIRQNPAP